jgi:hypothetical protein
MAGEQMTWFEFRRFFHQKGYLDSEQLVTKFSTPQQLYNQVNILFKHA